MKELFGTVERRHNTVPAQKVDQESGGTQFHAAVLFPFYPALSSSFRCTELAADSA